MDKQAYEHALGELSKENREEVARLEFSSKTKRVLAQRVGYVVFCIVSTMLFESVVTNTIYYGIAFVLYVTNIWEPTLTGIALLFGIGNAFDSIVSLVAYAFLLKKEKINILNV